MHPEKGTKAGERASPMRSPEVVRQLNWMVTVDLFQIKSCHFSYEN